MTNRIYCEGIWVGWDEAPFAFVALRGTPNPDAASVLKTLQESGLRVAMLSGDSVETTRAIAAAAMATSRLLVVGNSLRLNK